MVALRSHRKRSEPADGIRNPRAPAANAGPLDRITDSLREGDHPRSQFRVGILPARFYAALPRRARERNRSGRKKPAAQPTRPEYILALWAIGLVPFGVEPCG